ELAARLTQLERQAKKAEKYKKLKGEAREIELHHAAHRYLELHADRKVLSARLLNLSAEEKESLEKVRVLEEIIEQRRAALEADAAEIEALASDVHTRQAQVQLDDQNLAHWAADAEGTQRRVDGARDEV